MDWERYKNYLEGERKYAWKTSRDYIYYCKMLEAEIGDPLLARQFDVINEAIKVAAAKKKMQQNTLKKFGAAVVRFYKWAMREKLIENGENPYPFHDFRAERQKPPIEFFPDEDDVFGVLYHPRYTMQDLVELNVVWDTGFRAREMQTLEKRDLDLKSWTLTIRPENSKNGKMRVVGFTSKTKFLLTVYLATMALHYDGEILFPSKHWTLQPEGALAKKFKRLGNYESPKRGVVKMNPHKFRHSKPVKMFDDGAPQEFVQDQMGHSNPRETAHYTHYSLANIKKKTMLFGKRKIFGKPKVIVAKAV